MKILFKWRVIYILVNLLAWIAVLFAFVRQQYLTAIFVSVILLAFSALFSIMWKTMKKKGYQTEMEISRFLGKDAKEALAFGEVGILIYNDEYRVTWQSDYFKLHQMNLLNEKVTVWMENTRDLFEEDLDTVTGRVGDQVYEVMRKEGAQVLFVKNITEITELKDKLDTEEIVVGLMTLDNYNEYQSYENDEILNVINTRMRSSLITWAKDNGMFLRRLRSDRFLVILDTGILEKVKSRNFTILQTIKDQADEVDVSITLSMVFAYGTHNYMALDNMINDLLELVQSRGGDQVAIKKFGGKVVFIGGNSEKSSQRSTVRVNIVGATIEDLIEESPKVFVLGHTNTDYDCMGAALGVSNWVKALGREPYIVLKDVPRDKQLQQTMDFYKQTIDRHNLITPDDAARLIDPDRDLVIMVDHGIPAISSGRALLEHCRRVVVIDHHRRSENFVDSPLMAYVESTASSTCELVTELLQNSSVSIPIFEGEATIMYLGILVDTGRFKSHTSERTFQAAATLRSWGSNGNYAEKALQEDYDQYIQRTDLVSRAVPYKKHFMIAAAEQPVSRTMLSQVSDTLLQIKGCQASFTIGTNVENGKTAISARSDGTFNVQTIMEKMQGGGHFAAAAAEREDLTVEEAKKLLESLLDQVQEEEK
ncbi:MAG: DHH family phosphoesterase [Ileibacterium sp.]|nr:DHH family phosphoesterase [Ileibacterium sp.]